MIIARSADSVFREGDKVVLAKGTHLGTVAVFVRLNADPNWATIVERDGAVRSHPVLWLAHAEAPPEGSRK
jgi:hypothetical protein